MTGKTRATTPVEAPRVRAVCTTRAHVSPTTRTLRARSPAAVVKHQDKEDLREGNCDIRQ